MNENNKTHKRKLEEQKPQQQQQRQMRIYVKGQVFSLSQIHGNAFQDGNKMGFSIKPETQITLLLQAYCRRKLLPYRAVTFLIDNNKFNHKQTPQQLGLQDGGEIGAYMHMDGA